MGSPIMGIMSEAIVWRGHAMGFAHNCPLWLGQ